MQEAEAIGKASSEQLAEVCSFLVGKTSGVVIVCRVGQINFLVSHVKVATGNYWFLLIKLVQIIAVAVIPLLPFC